MADKGDFLKETGLAGSQNWGITPEGPATLCQKETKGEGTRLSAAQFNHLAFLPPRSPRGGCV